MQKYAGYALLGRPDIEQKFAYLHGPGENEESVFTETILKLFGEYEKNLNVFLSSFGDRHPTELYDLKGKRLILAEEPPERHKWAKGTLKEISASGIVVARKMRQDFVTFQAQCNFYFLAIMFQFRRIWGTRSKDGQRSYPSSLALPIQMMT